MVILDRSSLSGSKYSFRIKLVFPDICCFLDRLSTRAANQNQQVIALTRSCGPTLPQLILITHNGSGEPLITLHLSHQAIYTPAAPRFRLCRDNLFILSVAEGQVVRAFSFPVNRAEEPTLPSNLPVMTLIISSGVTIQLRGCILVPRKFDSRTCKIQV